MSVSVLVSVRGADEADVARRGGAGLIDVKEPSRGPLGRADDDVIEAVVHRIDGTLPVSAALGELRHDRDLPRAWEALAFLKWGLAGCAGTDWQPVLSRLAERVGSRAVVVAYADAEAASSPPVDEVVAFVRRAPWPDRVLLIDTFDKAVPRGLLDLLPPDRLRGIVEQCRTSDVRIALAGSLQREQIETVARLRPDWIGVRGAVCERGSRTGPLSAEALAELVRLPALRD